jgi:hypothetical protein
MSSFLQSVSGKCNFSCGEQGNVSLSPFYVYCSTASHIIIYYMYFNM